MALSICFLSSINPINFSSLSEKELIGPIHIVLFKGLIKLVRKVTGDLQNGHRDKCTSLRLNVHY